MSKNPKRFLIKNKIHDFQRTKYIGLDKNNMKSYYN